MTTNFSIDSIYVWQGSLEIVEGNVKFYPMDDFVGPVNIIVRAQDANTGNEVSGSIEVNVFELITPGESSSSLNAGEGITLSLPAGMVNSGSAELEIDVIEQAPSFQASSTTTNIEGTIISKFGCS